MSNIPPDWHKQYEQNGFSKSVLIQYLGLLSPYFRYPATPHFALSQAQKWAKLLAEHGDSYELIIGSGYPYYVLEIEQTHIPEYDRFFQEMLDKAHQLEQGWACPTCVSQNPRGDFDLYCAPCQSPFKALDIFYSLPDVDLLIVVETITEEVLQQIETTLFHRSGFVKPDTDLAKAVTELQQTMENMLYGQPNGFLRPDTFVLTIADYIQTHEQLAAGNLVTTQTSLLALHNIWLPYPTHLATDLFITGGNFLHVKNEKVAHYAQECIQKFVATFSTEQILNQFIAIWKELNPKNHRILTSSPPILQGIRQKIDRIRNGARP